MNKIVGFWLIFGILMISCFLASAEMEFDAPTGVRSYVNQMRRPAAPAFRYPLFGESTLRQMRPWRPIRRNVLYDTDGF
uniref:Uncharacterized protein n=1 Tax=Panagrolaimus sp. JU765 TaxID=591449 RepID=A0AC34R3Q9_9BILA